MDCDSKDETGRVARRYGAKVFNRPNHANIHLNTSFAIEKGQGPWLLNLDPDELVSPALKRAIDRAISDPNAPAAYDMPRKNHYFGTWLRWGGKYPDSVRRLYRKGKARFPNRHVHEKVTVDGEIGRLAVPVDHHPYPDLETFFRKLVFYAKFQADFLKKSGKKPTIFLGFSYLFWKPVRRFLSRYVMKLGFLDGLPGFLACLHDSLFHWLTWFYLSHKG